MAEGNQISQSTGCILKQNINKIKFGVYLSYLEKLLCICFVTADICQKLIVNMKKRRHPMRMNMRNIFYVGQENRIETI